jgi:vitellogenic carboxypeptidase-like protein
MRVFLWSFIIFLALVKGEDNTEPLILTPFIKSGQIQQAREHSLVKLKNSLANTTLIDDLPIEILSYSGLLTVDSGCNSNIFFWYFPSTVRYTRLNLQFKMVFTHKYKFSMNLQLLL